MHVIDGVLGVEDVGVVDGHAVGSAVEEHLVDVAEGAENIVNHIQTDALTQALDYHARRRLRGELHLPLLIQRLLEIGIILYFRKLWALVPLLLLRRPDLELTLKL